jgi:hypothetical protein
MRREKDMDRKKVERLVFLYDRTKNVRIKRKLRNKLWGRDYMTLWDLIKSF